MMGLFDCEANKQEVGKIQNWWAIIYLVFGFISDYCSIFENSTVQKNVPWYSKVVPNRALATHHPAIIVCHFGTDYPP